MVEQEEIGPNDGAEARSIASILGSLPAFAALCRDGGRTLTCVNLNTAGAPR